MSSTEVSEAHIEAQLVKRVEAMGGSCIKLEVRSRRGWPDRLCILPHGVIYFVELKKPTGRLSAHQKHCIKTLDDMGHNARVVWNMRFLRMLEQEMRVTVDNAQRLSEAADMLVGERVPAFGEGEDQ